ncbi:hypothetical protein A4G18_03470 [Pasteurellaceae bacterium Pebbles2]|nr:hypothetical protein [Pasteurellaceae bacterium Pebbles2]
METSSSNTAFFKSKAGKMTLAFIVTMIAFGCIMLGLNQSSTSLIDIGFWLMVAAMVYSPVDVFILNRKKK